jgi:hypothetical protein
MTCWFAAALIGVMALTLAVWSVRRESRRKFRKGVRLADLAGAVSFLGMFLWGWAYSNIDNAGLGL